MAFHKTLATLLRAAETGDEQAVAEILERMNPAIRAQTRHLAAKWREDAEADIALAVIQAIRRRPSGWPKMNG